MAGVFGPSRPSLQVRAREVRRQCGRQQFRQGSHGQATADLQGDRRRLDAARARCHSRAAIETIGEHRSRVLIGFNTGHYEAIDLSMWIAGNPPGVLATNLSKPESLFARFPHERVFIAPTEPRSQPEREVHSPGVERADSPCSFARCQNTQSSKRRSRGEKPYCSRGTFAPSCRPYQGNSEAAT